MAIESITNEDGNTKFVNGPFIGFIIAVGLNAGILMYYSNKSFPKNVESSYINPYELKTVFRDIDEDTFLETIKYKGELHLWKEDESGKPIAVPYEIKPGSVIEPQIIPQYKAEKEK